MGVFTLLLLFVPSPLGLLNQCLFQGLLPDPDEADVDLPLPSTIGQSLVEFSESFSFTVWRPFVESVSVSLDDDCDVVSINSATRYHFRLRVYRSQLSLLGCGSDHYKP